MTLGSDLPESAWIYIYILYIYVYIYIYPPGRSGDHCRFFSKSPRHHIVGLDSSILFL